MHAMSTETLNGSSHNADNGQAELAAFENDRKDKNDKDDTGRASGTPRIPELVYDLLPRVLRRVVRPVDAGREKDLVLTGLLAVSAAAMPNVLFRYGSRWQSLNLFVAALAPPGAGKGKFSVAKRCGKKLDRRLYKESRQEIERWERHKGDEDHEGGERPPERTLFLPGDSSAAALKRAIEANPHGVLFETEFKTVGAALAQDWGDFRDVFLKSYHNESVSVSRRRDDLLRIEHPSLSIALSGTPSTLSGIIESIDDGLFSRFCFYAFEAEPEWVPQFTGDGDEALSEAVGEAAGQLDGLHRALTERAEPLHLRFPEDLRKRHTTMCTVILEGLKSQDVPRELIPNLKRAGLNALRIAGIFSLLRLQERAADLSEAKSVEISEGDLTAGLALAMTYLSHALQVAGRMEKTGSGEGLSEDKQAYLDALPDGSFETKEAIDVADGLGIHRRTASRWLNRFAEDGLLVDVSHGLWRRPAFEQVEGVISVESVISVLFDQENSSVRPSIEGQSPF